MTTINMQRISEGGNKQMGEDNVEQFTTIFGQGEIITTTKGKKG